MTKLISVVVAAGGQASLPTALDSLARQSLPRDEFEVIVVDDDPHGGAEEACDSARARLDLRYVRIGRAEVAAKKNLGLFMTTTPLALFFDPEHVAGPDLLLAHLQAHVQHPELDAAMQTCVSWAPELRVTELMRFVAASRPAPQIHSCKRWYFVKFGIFRPFLPALDDLELITRLQPRGLHVMAWPEARQYVGSPATFDACCRRWELDGRALFALLRLHPRDSRIASLCQWPGASARWRSWKSMLPDRVARVQDLQSAEERGRLTEGLRAELRELYAWCFRAYRTKGMIERAAEEAGA